MGLHKVTVVSDGITYRIPGQDKPQPPNTWAVLPAYRGQDIELESADYDRFMALGAVVDAETHDAHLAKQGPLTGPPANAVRISGENDNLPIDKLRAEAKRLGFHLVGDDGEELSEAADEGGVSGAPPEGLDLADEKAVKALNVAQLKAAATQHGVELVSGDTKAKIVAKLVKFGKSQANS